LRKDVFFHLLIFLLCGKIFLPLPFFPFIFLHLQRNSWVLALAKKSPPRSFCTKLDCLVPFAPDENLFDHPVSLDFPRLVDFGG
jgi:hypothetical protein